MFRDARSVESYEETGADVCIIGAGPAGLTLARELADRGHAVLIVESGGLECDSTTQQLADGELTGDWYQPLIEQRARQFGGTSNFWNSGAGHGQLGFRVGPLAPTDFERRKWLPDSVGWPFGRETLDPYYVRVHEQIGLGSYEYRGQSWTRGQQECLPLDDAEFHSTVWQFGRTETFTCTLKDGLRDDPRITVLLHANVTEILMREGGTSVRGVRVQCLGGKSFDVAARTVVLAAGGIENPRLLLMSRSVQAQGIGNQYDQVGRYFMEHQFIRGGRVYPRSRRTFATAGLYDTHAIDGILRVGKVSISPGLMRSANVMNGSFALVPRHRLHHRANYAAIHAVATLVRSAQRGKIAPDAPRLAMRALAHGDFIAASILRKVSKRRLFPYFMAGPDLVAGDSWSALPDQDKRWDWFDLILHTEQAPHRDNRVTLSQKRDALGNPLPLLHWEWRKADIESVRKLEQLFAASVERAGVGRVEILLEDDKPVIQHPGLHHHMGTTRMHPDERLGVVDENCRVHGVSNLFVAGCSVFPSGGYINPTLTILALSLRLGDHLAMKIERPVRIETQVIGASNVTA